MTPTDTSSDTNRIYTPTEVAELLSCSRTHVYRLVTTGVLRAINIAAPDSNRPKTRIRQRDLDEYLTASQMS